MAGPGVLVVMLLVVALVQGVRHVLARQTQERVLEVTGGPDVEASFGELVARLDDARAPAARRSGDLFHGSAEHLAGAGRWRGRRLSLSARRPIVRDGRVMTIQVRLLVETKLDEARIGFTYAGRHLRNGRPHPLYRTREPALRALLRDAHVLGVGKVGLTGGRLRLLVGTIPTRPAHQAAVLDLACSIADLACAP